MYGFFLYNMIELPMRNLFNTETFITIKIESVQFARTEIFHYAVPFFNFRSAPLIIDSIDTPKSLYVFVTRKSTICYMNARSISNGKLGQKYHRTIKNWKIRSRPRSLRSVGDNARLRGPLVLVGDKSSLITMSINKLIWTGVCQGYERLLAQLSQVINGSRRLCGKRARPPRPTCARYSLF